MKNNEKDDFVEKVVKDTLGELEKQHGTKIFTVRILDDEPSDEQINFLAVFEDKAIIKGFITIEHVAGNNLGSRIRANYI